MLFLYTGLEVSCHMWQVVLQKKKNSTAEFCMSMYILHFTFCTVLLMLSRNSPRNFWYCEFIDLGFRKSLKSRKLSATHEQTLSARSLPLKEIQTSSPDSGSQYYIPYVFDSVSRNRRYGRPPPVKHQGNEKKIWQCSFVHICEQSLSMLILKQCEKEAGKGSS